MPLLTLRQNGVPAITALEDAKNIMMELQNDLADDEDGNPLIQPQAIDTLEALAEDARLELDGKTKFHPHSPPFLELNDIS